MDDELLNIISNLGEHLKNAAEQQKRHDELAVSYMQSLKRRIEETSPNDPIVAIIRLDQNGVSMDGRGAPDLVMFAAAMHMSSMREAVEKYIEKHYKVSSDCCRHALMAGLFNFAVKNGDPAAYEKEEGE